MTSDIVFVRNLTVQAILGVLPEERRSPQSVVVNLQIHSNTKIAAQSKQLTDTIDYAQVAQAIEQLAQAQRCLLVETLAEEIANLVLEYDAATAVSVDVAKPDALPQADAVGVRIYRSR